MEGRTKNGMRNIGSGIINRVILIFLPFVARTIVMYVLGEEFLGLSGLFTSILTVLNLSELGFGSALVFSMYKPAAQNDIKTISSLLNLYKKIYRRLGTVILIVGVSLSFALPFIIKDDIPSDINIYILYFLYLINTVVSYFAFAHRRAILIAYQRSDIISNINSLVTIVSYTLQIVLLFAFKNYYLYICVLPIITIADNIIVGLLSEKKFPDIKCKGIVSKETKASLINHVKGIALQKICSTSRNSFDNIAISMFIGLSSVAIYGNYYYIMSSIHALLYQLPNSIRASVGNSVANETVDKNYSDFNKFNFIYMWISGCCTVCLFCLFQQFMRIWMGDNLLLPLHSVILLCMYFFALSMGDMIALYKDGAGLWWHGRYRTLIEAIANLILNLVLGYFFGINGIIFATNITIMIFGIGYGAYIVFKNYFKERKLSVYIKTQLGYLLAVSIITTITYFICELLPFTGIINLILRLLTCFVLSNALLWVIFHNTKIYIIAIDFLCNSIKRSINKK
jgi:O-antigen/teichoic acid export membrane protein